MTKRRTVPSVRLVVDTNVLRGASRTATSAPPGSTLRAVLEGILHICHRAVVSPALEREYRTHASSHGVRWLVAMRRRGKVIETNATLTSRARRWMQSEELRSPQQKAELEKDVHLVLAAIETDGIVVSCETNVRDLLLRVMEPNEIELGWALVSEETTRWLAGGAPLALVRLETSEPSK